jgi:hypothetical protein
MQQAKKSKRALIEELHRAYLEGLLTYRMTPARPGEQSALRILFEQDKVAASAIKRLAKHIRHEFVCVERVDLLTEGAFSEIHVLCATSGSNT